MITQSGRLPNYCGTIARWEGFGLGYYLAHTVYLVVESTQHETLPAFSKILVVFVLPIIVVTLVVLTVRGYARSKKHRYTDQAIVLRLVEVPLVLSLSKGKQAQHHSPSAVTKEIAEHADG